MLSFLCSRRAVEMHGGQTTYSALAMSIEQTPLETPPKSGPGLVKLIKIVACVAVLVLLEVGAAMALLPTAEDTKKIGQQLAQTGQEKTDGEDAGAPEGDRATDAEHVDPHVASREVTLGAYHVVSFNPSTGTSTAIDFELFGVVLAADEVEFAERYLVHEKRLNEQVTIAIRSMQPSDFSDPGLGLIKRVILEKVNRALGKTLVREAIFSEFSFMERE